MRIDVKFKTSLDYKGKPCLKNKNHKLKKNNKVKSVKSGRTQVKFLGWHFV